MDILILRVIHTFSTIDTRATLEKALHLPHWRHPLRRTDLGPVSRCVAAQGCPLLFDAGRAWIWSVETTPGCWLTFTYHQCSGYPVSRRFGWQPRKGKWVLKGNRGGPMQRRTTASWTMRKEEYPPDVEDETTRPNWRPTVIMYYHLDQYLIGWDNPRTMEVIHFPYQGIHGLFRQEERGTWIAFAVVYGISFISYWMLRWWGL